MKNMMTGLRAMRDGSQLIGWGMAPGKNIPSKALVRLQPDAEFWLRRGRQEIRTGTDTIIPQITADVLSTSPDLVDARLGDTNYPETPISAGSMSTASVSPPLSRPPLQARQKFVLGARSPVHAAGLEEWNSKAAKYF
jgi:xanthine dehydrogenase YagR molybdenum-binding subunit